MKLLSAAYVLPIAADSIRNGAVLIDEDKIIEVGALEQLSAKYANAEHEDFGEAVILPGFVNAHSHLEISAMRGFLDDVEADFYSWLIKLTVTRAEKLTDEDIDASALFGAVEGARAGVTCFGDIGRSGRSGLQALKKVGLRGVVYQETDFSPKDETADADFARLLEKFTALKAEETDLVKIGISPHAPYTVSRAFFEKITEFALANDVKLTIHAAESNEEREFFLTGEGFFADLYAKLSFDWKAPRTSPIQYLADIGVLRAKPLLAHCVKVSDADIETIAANGTGIAHCPKSNAKFGHGIAPLEKFLNQKIRVGVGSDSVASNNVCDILEEARFAVLSARTRNDKKRFIGAEEILRTTTLGGAEALGLENEIGSLEAGKQADLIVVSLDNCAQMPIYDVHSALLFASNARDVRLTMVAGQEIFRNGEMRNVNEQAAKMKINEIGEKLRLFFFK